MENAANAIFPLTWEIIQVSLLRKHAMDLESWCLANFLTSGSPGSLPSSANKDSEAQPLDPHLISPGCWLSNLVWPSPLRAPFISNTKWSCVVKWSLLFLIADSRDSCWLSVSVLYFVSLICSQLNLIEFTWAKKGGTMAILKALNLK